MEEKYINNGFIGKNWEQYCGKDRLTEILNRSDTQVDFNELELVAVV